MTLFLSPASSIERGGEWNGREFFRTRIFKDVFFWGGGLRTEIGTTYHPSAVTWCMDERLRSMIQNLRLPARPGPTIC